MGPPAHLADEALLLHLSPELPQRLLELLRILDYDLQPEITPFFEVSSVQSLPLPRRRQPVSIGSA
jgi:hypothetical protein